MSSVPAPLQPRAAADGRASPRSGFKFMRAARGRMRHWFESRLPRADAVTLTQRNVYILPTRPGLMLVATLLTLLVASINYQLNLGYLLTFLLAGSTVVGMHVCHGTLRGLTLNLIAPQPVFAWDNAVLSIQLTNASKRARHGIGAAVMDGTHDERWAWSDVAAGGTSVVHVAFTPERRGRIDVPTLTAETRFPLGTFRVWTVWRPAAQVLVYPAPEPHPPPLPPGEPRAGGANVRTASQPASDFDSVRAYRRGDAMKQIVWRKSAKTDELVSRDTQQVQRHELWLDLAGAGPGDAEARLSRLAAWVLQADRLGADYGLRLGGTTVKPDSGDVHRLRCLEALALH